MGHAGGNDLQWPGGHSACTANTTFADPLLGPLADNGGPTLTMMPSAAAEGVQLGEDCPATDQTGRPCGSPCTLGAVEQQEGCVPPVVPNPGVSYDSYC